MRTLTDCFDVPTFTAEGIKELETENRMTHTLREIMNTPFLPQVKQHERLGLS